METVVGECVHSKNCLVSSRQHRATEVQKLHFCSSYQYTHGCCVPASWAARHTTVCLDVNGSSGIDGFNGKKKIKNLKKIRWANLEIARQTYFGILGATY